MSNDYEAKFMGPFSIDDLGPELLNKLLEQDPNLLGSDERKKFEERAKTSMKRGHEIADEIIDNHSDMAEAIRVVSITAASVIARMAATTKSPMATIQHVTEMLADIIDHELGQILTDRLAAPKTEDGPEE